MSKQQEAKAAEPWVDPMTPAHRRPGAKPAEPPKDEPKEQPKEPAKEPAKRG